MKKQEAIEEINNLPVNACYERPLIDKKDVKDIINQIDEPEKPVIPQFVAELIRYCKSNKLTLLGAFDPVSEHGIGLANTFTGEVWKAVDWAKRNQDIFACAWLFGYEVEKEKLYTVEIPNPNTDAVTCLARDEETGKIVIDCLWEMDEVKNGWKLDNDCQLAESEIRKDFEWAWEQKFAKEVD